MNWLRQIGCFVFGHLWQRTIYRDLRICDHCRKMQHRVLGMWQ